MTFVSLTAVGGVNKTSTLKTCEVLKPGNSKLGATIGKVALPAVVTCPGRGACESFCYAKKLMKLRPNVNDYYYRCMDLLENDIDSYFKNIQQSIDENMYSVVRIHESGDFYTVEQIRGWIALVQNNPTVSFFGYTRSWTTSLKPVLEELRNEPNVQLFASVEKEEVLRSPDGWRWAWVGSGMLTNHRDGTNTINVPAARGATLCLEQTGAAKSCASCGFCFTAPKNNTVNVMFNKH